MPIISSLKSFRRVLSFERWQGIVGAYYFDAMARGAFDTILGNAGFTQGTSGRVDTESYAAFGDVSFDVSERFSAAVGARWTRDSKDATNFKANYLGLGSPISGRNVAPFQILTNYSNSKDFEEVTPRASVTFEATRRSDGLRGVWARIQIGRIRYARRCGGIPGYGDGYEPEIVDSYEIGLKGRLADGRVTYAGAIFDQEYKDQQVTIQRPGLTPTSPVVSVVENVGKSRIRGAEFEATAAFTEAFEMKLAASYLDAEFLEYVTFNPVTRQNEDVADQRFVQNTPEWMGSLGLTYRLSLADRGELISRAPPPIGTACTSSKSRARRSIRTRTRCTTPAWSGNQPPKSWQLGVYGRN